MLLNSFFIFAFLSMTLGISHIKLCENRASFVKTLIIGIWTTISIGAVIALFMNFAHIPIKLMTISVAYLICAALIWVYLLLDRKHRIQKFEVRLSEFLGVVFCIVFVGGIFVKAFGLDLSISYNCTDAGSHFRLASDILETHRLNRMYFAALYNSLIMEMFAPFLTKVTIYKAFILADASLNLLNILMFYVVASEFVKSKFSKISIYAVLIFYFLGWPVWSWISGGYVYFGAGITAYLYGIYLLIQLGRSQQRRVKGYYLTLILLTVFCISECYLLYAPIFLLTVIVYVLYEKRNVLTKKNLVLGLLGFALMGIVIFAAAYWGYFNGNIDFVFKAFRFKGGIHTELYRDFIFLLPINIYLCVTKVKEKRIDIIMLATVCQIAVVIVALIAKICGFMSDYYYFKLYYLGWALQMVGVFQAVNYFWQEKRQVIYYCILPIAIIAAIEITGINQKIIVSDSDGVGIFPVITQSINTIKTAHNNKEERRNSLISLAGWVNNNLQNEDVPLATDTSDLLLTWYPAFTNSRVYSVLHLEVFNEEKFDNMITDLKKNNSKYFAIIQDTKDYYNYKNKLDQFEEVYSDGFYGIYKIE